MMRNRRLLRMMAGLSATQADRRMQREQRKLRRAEQEANQRVLLVDQIRQREQGSVGMKPMPFAKGDGNG